MDNLLEVKCQQIVDILPIKEKPVGTCKLPPEKKNNWRLGFRILRWRQKSPTKNYQER